MTVSDFFAVLGVNEFGAEASGVLNCGAGMSLENEENGGDDDSFMIVRSGVDGKVFKKFLKNIENTGRKELFHREFNGNIFSQFENGEHYIYTYYIDSLGEARIILDNSTGCSASEADNRSEAQREGTALMQFSLKYGKMIPGFSCDCGMLYALRLRDNSVIIIDGGEREQATEDACDEFMDRLYDLTNTENGGKIRVSAYICTHNHDDHMDFFIKLLRREKDVLILERVMFNIPSRTMLGYCRDNPCTDELRKRIKKYAPDAKYIKIHTGQTFKFPDAVIEILTTHEDILPSSPRAGGDDVYRSINESTTVFSINFDDTTVIFLGDAEDANGENLINIYGRNFLSCEYLQCAHHLINDDRNIYSNIKARKLLIPQSRFIGDTTEVDNTRYLTDLFGEKNMFYAGDCTYVFTVVNGMETISRYEQKGYYYDNSEF